MEESRLERSAQLAQQSRDRVRASRQVIAETGRLTHISKLTFAERPRLLSDEQQGEMLIDQEAEAEQAQIDAEVQATRAKPQR